MKRPILLGAVFLFLPVPSPEDGSQDGPQTRKTQTQKTQTRKTRPVDVFKDLDGHWVGTFVGYDQAGNEQYRLHVEQWYKTVDDNTQEVRIKDTLEGGKIVTAKGKNIARRRKDGGLELSCEVLKSTGEKVLHKGRLVRGPAGDKQLVWYSKGKHLPFIIRYQRLKSMGK